MSQTVIRDSRFIGQTVKAELERQDLSQADLARELGVTNNWVSRRIRGEVPFTAVELDAVAEVLDVPLDHLLGRAA